mmetsp:Transcript_20523/g.59542  ORF Transcript_20523/g.59542 Transcript_20523/m.59542 type:complete len:285 (-) Transcript_20523:484-1338(-)
MGCCASTSAPETRRQLRCFRCYNPLGPRIPAGWYVCIHCGSSTTPVVRTTSGGHYRTVAERQLDLLPLSRSGLEACRYCSVLLPVGGASCPSCVAGTRAVLARQRSARSGGGVDNGCSRRRRVEVRIAPSQGRERPQTRNFALEQSSEAMDALALQFGVFLSALDGSKADTTRKTDRPRSRVLCPDLECAIDDTVESVSCPVCLEVMSVPMLLTCGHSLCSKHVDHLRNGCCPVCRATFALVRCNHELCQNIKVARLLESLTGDSDKEMAAREALSLAEVLRHQ